MQPAPAPPQYYHRKQPHNGLLPKKTLEDTQYCVKVWQDWCEYRQQVCGNHIDLKTLQHCQLQHWLTRFVLEVRRDRVSVQHSL